LGHGLWVHKVWRAPRLWDSRKSQAGVDSIPSLERVCVEKKGGKGGNARHWMRIAGRKGFLQREKVVREIRIAHQNKEKSFRRLTNARSDS